MMIDQTYFTLTEFQAKFCNPRPHEACRASREGVALTKICEDRKIQISKKKLNPVRKTERKPETGTLHDLATMNTYPKFILEEFYRAILKGKAA
jgi:hypothetical protein